MLGAAHACSNPLTARHDLAHGLALSILLPHVVRWNAPAVAERYAMLIGSHDVEAAPERLAVTLETLARAGGLGGRLQDHGVPSDALPDLAALAAEQWTGAFNPRQFDAAGALEIYRAAYLTTQLTEGTEVTELIVSRSEGGSVQHSGCWLPERPLSDPAPPRPQTAHRSMTAPTTRWPAAPTRCYLSPPA